MVLAVRQEVVRVLYAKPLGYTAVIWAIGMPTMPKTSYNCLMDTTEHEPFIRQCYELAQQAVAQGDHPFGAVLVKDGQVLLTAVNTIFSQRDITRHAEMNLVSQACRLLDGETLAQCTLYTSTEPCAMCTGAIFWAGIPTIVYGCDAVALGNIATGRFVVPSRELLARATRPTTVIGPVLPEEGCALHLAYWPLRYGQSLAE
ncbi:MAG: nucleoside deaminase [Anaerolineales bacterium]|nr:nucleoside deaminase [Anaerolineales bacterium]